MKSGLFKPMICGHFILILTLWDGDSFLSIGFILAEAQITFKAPVTFGQAVRVGVRVTRLGNKSLDMIYRIEDAQTGEELACGSSVLVTYDYQSGTTMPIPVRWRGIIAEFENIQTAMKK